MQILTFYCKMLPIRCLLDLFEINRDFRFFGKHPYFHYKMCLRSWLDATKSVEKIRHVTKYQWDNVQCELCKNYLE